MSGNTNDGNKKNDKYNDKYSINNESIEMILKNKQHNCDASSCEFVFDNIIFDFPKKLEMSY